MDTCITCSKSVRIFVPVRVVKAFRRIVAMPTGSTVGDYERLLEDHISDALEEWLRWKGHWPALQPLRDTRGRFMPVARDGRKERR